MSNHYKKAILPLLLVIFYPITAQEPNNIISTGKKCITPCLIITSFLIGYWSRSISYKKNLSLISNNQSIVQISNNTIPTPQHNTDEVDEKYKELQKDWEKEKEKNNQLTSQNTYLEEENIYLKQENIGLKKKVNTINACIKKLFPTTMKSGNYSAVRLKLFYYNQNEANQSEPLESIAHEFINIFELRDSFKPSFNTNTNTWLFERIYSFLV